MTETHFASKFLTEQEALNNCPDYCHVEYCEDCKAWHVIQD